MLFPRSVTPDADLVRAVLQGHTQQFGVLVARYQNLVCHTLLSRLSHPDEADDLAQETFLKAFRRLSDLEEPGKFGPWVRRIAENLAFSALRSRQVSDRLVPQWLPSPVAQPDELFEAQERGERIWAALEALSLEDREIVLLFYQEECSQEQIAAFLDLSPGAVKARLYRARSALREELAEEFDRQVKQVVQAGRKGKEFTRKVMGSLPLVPWYLPVGQALLSWSRWGWGLAVGVSLSLSALALVLGLRSDPQSKAAVAPAAMAAAPGMRVQWAPAQAGSGGYSGESPFGGALSREARAAQEEALRQGRGGRLVWDFEGVDTQGWVARSGPGMMLHSQALRAEARHGVLRVPLDTCRQGSISWVELISPEIGYESRLFDRAEVRVRVVDAAPVHGGFGLAWTNPLNQLFPGQDPHNWERRTEEQWKAESARARQGKGRVNPFAVTTPSPVTYTSAWQDLTVDRLGEQEGVRWEGALGDLRFTFRLGDNSRSLEAESAQFPRALEIDRIALRRSQAALEQDLAVPGEESPAAAGTWLGEGRFNALDQTGLERPILGDLDGDGDLDLVVSYQLLGAPYSNTQQGFVTALNDGQGRFVLCPKQVLESRHDGTSSIVRLDGADLNQDGLLDLVVGQGLDTRIFLNQGKGAFWEDRFWENQVYVGRGDVDGDGKVDVVTSPYQRGTHDLPQEEQHHQARLYLNYGEGVLVDREVEIPTEGGWFPYALDDYDGDGRAELVWWWSAEKGLESRLLVWDGYAGGQWLQQSLISFLGLPEVRQYYVPSRLVCLGDLQADGRWKLGVPLETYADIGLCTAGVEVASPGTGVVPWLSRQVRIRHSMTHQPSLIPQVWDLNGDGVFDPLFLDGEYRAGSHLRVLQGQKGQLPVEEGLYPLPAAPHGWAVGDVDGDRQPDVLVVVEGIEGAGVYVLRNVLGERVGQGSGGLAQE